MKNILVPTDLTEIADNGLKLAVKIAQRADARIFLINFVEAPPSSNFSVTGDVTQSGGDAANIYTIELLKKNRERLAAIASDYASDGLNIEVNVVDADFKEGVLREVKEKNIDLIVMGTTGTHNFPEYFTGNHTEQLIEHLPCPVISVKEDYIDGQLDRIVVAIDLFHEYGQKDFDHIFDLAKFFEAKVHVVYLNEKSKDAGKLKEKARAFKSAHFREADEFHIIDGNDLQHIADYANQVNAGLIFTLTEAKSGFIHALTNSFSEDLVSESKIPIVTIHQ